MELLAHLKLGLAVALSVDNALYCLLGTLVGTFIGVLPGLGPLATIALLLPLTYGLDPTAALIMLAGIYYGAQYGGSTTAILLNMPGEVSAVATALDGHRMAQDGRARQALLVAALASFFAGTVATLLIAALAGPVSALALRFGPADYCALMALGLVAAVATAQGSTLKAVAMIVLGLLLGLVGTDVNTGVRRFTFDIPELYDGIDVAAVAMGLFGIAEILRNLEGGEAPAATAQAGRGRWWPDRTDRRRAGAATLRGTGLGALLGVLPGSGPVLAAFAAYVVEKKLAADPRRLGSGAIEGVAAPEAANNAAAQTAFIPMLALGLPSNAMMALMIAALTLHDIQPGPQVMSSNPPLFWGLIASMWIGNAFLLVLNLPLLGLWVRLLAIPYRLLYPAILLLSCVGMYAISSSAVPVLLMMGFGVFGYLAGKLGCEPAPLVLGFVLGPPLEENLRRALTLSRGDPAVFMTEPISFALLVTATALLATSLLPALRRRSG
ncbi:hypothetical protein dqs_2514 [Azoarcus olearius]|uniref:tripartite tricarboxylate transporter permease n=1 Tax=Azoarcus sp. (strain BH72) TaxID=418699 RepID=UPI0008063740|nr:tripartite tricarboxylate transporter permease [Azoarcus olearius]ANQ85544.1 hypothetical protein dqs_2514 [Azoarcus olearius]